MLPLTFDRSHEERFNYYGKIPVVNVLSGFARVLYCVAMLIFNNAASLIIPHARWYRCWNSAALRNLRVGAIQMIPIIGNRATLHFESRRMSETDVD